MKRIAILNHKGGVGKTTTAINLAASISQKGKKVLLIDMDPQSNLTQALGIIESEKTIYDSFRTGEPLPVLKYSEMLYLVPSTLDFTAVEIELANRLAREKILQELLQPLDNDFDYCIIDSPPSMGIIVLNILVAVEDIYSPMDAEYFSFRGIDSIAGLVSEVKRYYNPNLAIRGMFFNKYNPNRILTREVERQLEEEIGTLLMDTKIRMNVALAEAQTCGKHIFDYNADSAGAKDFKKLTNEILKQ